MEDEMELDATTTSLAVEDQSSLTSDVSAAETIPVGEENSVTSQRKLWRSSSLKSSETPDTSVTTEELKELKQWFQVT
jgi:hypothetical protein